MPILSPSKLLFVLSLLCMIPIQAQSATKIPVELIKDLHKRHKVKVVYFVPSGREPAPEYAKKIKVLLSFVNAFYKDDLGRKGFPNRQFDFEFEGEELNVNFVRGEKPFTYYTGDLNHYDVQTQMHTILPEVETALGSANSTLYLIFAETYEENDPRLFTYYPNPVWPMGGVGLGSYRSASGGVALASAWVLRNEFAATNINEQLRLMTDDTPTGRPNWIYNFDPEGKGTFVNKPDAPVWSFVSSAVGLITHELGHAIGAYHDRTQEEFDVMAPGLSHMRGNFVAGDVNNFFSWANGRLIATSRFLNEQANENDNTYPGMSVYPPSSIKFNTDKVEMHVEYRDETQLAGTIFFDFNEDTIKEGFDVGPKDPNKSYHGESMNVTLDRETWLSTYEIWASVFDASGNMSTQIIKIPVEPKNSVSAGPTTPDTQATSSHAKPKKIMPQLSCVPSER
jgi:hypothetical protein